MQKDPPSHGLRSYEVVTFRTPAVKWAGAKLQGDDGCFSLHGNEWSCSSREINQHPRLPRNFVTHFCTLHDTLGPTPPTPPQKFTESIFCAFSRGGADSLHSFHFGVIPLFSRHSYTRVRVPPVALHVSRYMCRSRFPQNSGLFRCSTGIAPHPPIKGPVAPVALQLPGVSHVKLRLTRCRATGGCGSYTCGCRATLCNYVSRGTNIVIFSWGCPNDP